MTSAWGVEHGGVSKGLFVPVIPKIKPSMYNTANAAAHSSAEPVKVMAGSKKRKALIAGGAVGVGGAGYGLGRRKKES